MGGEVGHPVPDRLSIWPVEGGRFVPAADVGAAVDAFVGGGM